MKNLKMFLALLLVLAMIFTFSACGSNDDGNGGDTASEEQTQDVETEAEDDNDLFDEEDEELFDDPVDETTDSTVDGDTEETDEDDEEETDDEAQVPAEITGDYTGEFGSNTDTSLNLTVKWAAEESDEGTYNVLFRFYINCYSLHVGDRDGNVLKVETSKGSKEVSFHTDEINRDDNSPDEILVGETTVKMTADELASGAKVEATYDFRGSYSGKDLSQIVAKGEVKGN